MAQVLIRRAMVTGAHGLVGRWVVAELLARGVAVAVLRRSEGRVSALALDGLEARCDVVPGDLADPAALERALIAHRADTVVHLAAQSRVGEALTHPLGTWETNVRGTWNLLEACRRARVSRVVLASSGRAADPTDPYGASKACAELVAGVYTARLGLPVAVGRLPNVYGPGDLDPTRLVPELVAAAIAGRAPRLGAHDAVREFAYVEDVAAALIALAEVPPPRAPVTIGGERRTVGELATLVAALAAAPPPAPAPAPTPPPAHRIVDSPPPGRSTDDSTQGVGLREGLRRTLAWARDHPGAFTA